MLQAMMRFFWFLCEVVDEIQDTIDEILESDTWSAPKTDRKVNRVFAPIPAVPAPQPEVLAPVLYQEDASEPAILPMLAEPTPVAVEIPPETLVSPTETSAAEVNEKTLKPAPLVPPLSQKTHKEMRKEAMNLFLDFMVALEERDFDRAHQLKEDFREFCGKRRLIAILAQILRDGGDLDEYITDDLEFAWQTEHGFESSKCLEDVPEHKQAVSLLYALLDKAKKDAGVIAKVMSPVQKQAEFKKKSWDIGARFTEALRLGNIGAAKAALRQLEELGESRPDLHQRVQEAAELKTAQKNGRKKQKVRQEA